MALYCMRGCERMKRLAQLTLFILACVAVGFFGFVTLYTLEWQAGVLFIVYIGISWALYDVWIRGK